MAQWAVTISADRWATERLFRHDILTMPEFSAAPELAGLAGRSGGSPSTGDEALVVTAGPGQQQVVALGRIKRGGATTGAETTAGDLSVAYTRRAFDQPVPADGLGTDTPVAPLGTDVYRRLAARLRAGPDQRSWLVSVNLPIEADTAAEAVRQFWSYVMELGPAELPALVSPSDDELAVQAFVLGEPANQDPEEGE